MSMSKNCKTRAIELLNKAQVLIEQAEILLPLNGEARNKACRLNINTSQLIRYIAQNVTTEDRAYHTLLTRDNSEQSWGIAFGDYDRELVEAEATEYIESGYTNSNIKFITTSDRQDDINEKVKQWNKGI